VSDELYTRNAIRAVLKMWNSSRKLGEHPLARLPFVAARMRQTHIDDTPTGRGVALREILHRLVQSLRPEGEPNYGDKRWRPYLILTEQYVNGRKPEYLAELFGLVRGSFHQEQARALELLGDALKEQVVTGFDSPTPPHRNFAPVFLAPTRPPYSLVGRDVLLASIKQHLIDSTAQTLSIYGLPGVGKTALAIDIANDKEVLSQFVDGVLWAGMGKQPDIEALLGNWANALGLSRDDIGRLTTIQSRAQAIQNVIGLRRMLIVIDDAWNIDDAHAFKLGGANCAHLMTTRLPNVAMDFAGDNIVHASELDHDDGVRLLTQHAPDAVEAHRAKLDTLVRSVGSLPLALTLMGRRLRKVALGNQTRRAKESLDELVGIFAESKTSEALFAVIEESNSALDEKSRDALRVLSAFPPKPNTFSEEAALAVAECGTSTLDALVDDGLIENRGARYSLHQTICDFARRKNENDDLRKNIYARMLSHYTQRLEGSGGYDFSLDVDLSNFIAALDAAREHSLNAQFIRGVTAVFPYLESRGILDEAERHLEQAQELAMILGDEVAAAKVLRDLGRVARRRGKFDAAQRLFDEARIKIIDAIDPTTALMRATILLNQCTLANDRGERERAEIIGQDALSLARELNDPKLISAILTQLGAASGFRAAFDRSKGQLDEALRYAKLANDKHSECLLTLGLGLIASWLGDVKGGDAHFQRSYEMSKEIDARETASIARAMQGWVNANIGEYPLAIDQSRESLSLIREGSYCESAGLAYTNLGFVAMNRGDSDAAQMYVNRGMSVVRQIDHKEGMCMMFNAQSRLYAEIGDYEKAESYSREGIRFADEMGYFELMPSMMATLGEALNAREAYDDADGFFILALGMANEMKRPWLVTYAQNVWGDCLLRREEIDKAQSCFQESLRVAQMLKAKPYEAISLFGLAKTASMRGHTQLSSSLAKESLDILQAIGHVRAKKVRAWLTAAALASHSD
jgi:tetratricopeptide (TPR) repeat protein